MSQTYCLAGKAHASDHLGGLTLLIGIWKTLISSGNGSWKPRSLQKRSELSKCYANQGFYHFILSNVLLSHAFCL